MKTPTRDPLIRLPVAAYRSLKAMSKETGKAMSDIASDAIERYSRERFWEEVDRAYAAMTPEQWREYRREFKEWEVIAGDTWPVEDWKEEHRAGRPSATAQRRSVVDGSRSGSRSRAGRRAASDRRIG